MDGTNLCMVRVYGMSIGTMVRVGNGTSSFMVRVGRIYGTSWSWYEMVLVRVGSKVWYEVLPSCKTYPLVSRLSRAPAAGFSAGSTRAFRNAAAAACMDVIPAKACDPFQRYRETDGQCNNLFYRSEPNGAFKLGAAFTAQGRFLFPDYDNGVNSPRVRSVIQPFVLPNARFVSLSAHSGTAFQSDRHTPFLTHFGQFIDHDIVSTPEVETGE
ncbi:hypothetical protein FSP39_023992 [Pinctada imbricata]|uniref:Uncharacterized protein n=1 Tax=Pinctada imbricata TaxID=66713 RepID=A0AA88YGC6_PINIB|nr:hypothetical protein FSP39_023992 [Pinctada imbricata]